MNKLGFIIIFFVLGIFHLIAQTGQLFIDSEPLGADIRLDGQDLTKKTPVLLRDITTGSHDIVLLVRNQIVWRGKTTVLPDKASVIKGDLALGQMIYQVSYQGEATLIKPLFPDDSLLTFSFFMVPTLAGAAGLSTYLDMTSSDAGKYPLKAGTLVLWSATAGDFLWSILLNERKKAFEKTLATAQLPPLGVKLGSVVFDEGVEAFQNGRMDQASAAFAILLKDYQNSSFIAGAWFLSARIHALRGFKDQARIEYRIVAEDLVQPQYFDKAQKALADIEEEDGHWAEAIKHLQAMVFFDPLFTKTEIALHIKDLKAKLSETLNRPEVKHE